MLTPMEIHNHQFKKSFRGYSENEVDDFLDRIVADFEKLQRDNERLKNQVEALNREIEQYRKLEKNLNETLMVAQRTADEVISAAKKNADNIKENTALECQNIRNQTQHEAQQLLDGATIKRDEMLTEYARLVREKHEFMLKLRTMLESELAITNQTLSTVPHVEEPPKRSAPVAKIPEPVAEQPAPEEIAEPVEKIPAPVEKVAEPVEKIPAPVAKVPAPVEEPPLLIDDYAEMNLVDVSTKPVVEEKDAEKIAEKSAVSDDTLVYKPVKKSAQSGGVVS
ncbi:MAG: DivIVA domain-containing protein [Selenomonadaceae bacterium]|nr:DivIVA domain-containing protein [Selenomonadaceae bacterium]